jgi:hypothetical protein
MNLFKFSYISFLFLFSFVLVTPAFAVETPPVVKTTTATTAVNGASTVVVLATVNIQKANIVSQNGNDFNISFVLTNETGVQSGVNYGVSLVGIGPKNQFVFDEKIYGESLTLGEKSNITKEIIYEAPKILSGTYNLYLTVKNASGFTFGRVPIKGIILKSSESGLLISPQSCSTQIVNGKNGTRYDLLQRVDITKDETLRLTCDAVNGTDKDLSVTPSFETFIGSTYGKVATQIGGSTEAITFKSKEQKTFSVNLPTVSFPQNYTVKVKLVGSDIVSNTVSPSYFLSGPNATIRNLSLDKDYYKKGDNATLSLLYNSIENNSQSKLFVKATILNSKGKECISPINQPLIQNTQSPVVEIPALIENDCLNPNVSVTILDDKGTVLDQKDFNVTSISLSTSAKKANTIALIFLIIILVVAGIILYFRNLKKKQNEIINQ